MEDKFSSAYCCNCGKRGHSYKACVEPIISIGVILFRTCNSVPKKILDWSKIRTGDKPELDDKSSIDDLEFLLIRRKDSLGYVEFLRGRYALSDIEFIRSIFEEMTQQEKIQINTMDFESLWCSLWMLKSSEKRRKESFRKEYITSKNKFNKIKKGYFVGGEFINLENLLDSLKNNWRETEWGFPKGRRNVRESDIDCASRELMEETGIDKDDYFIYRNIKPYEEIFLGSNNVIYKHIYFLGRYTSDKPITLDITNRVQASEIGAIQWMNLNILESKIRYYNEKRIKIVKHVINNIKYKGLDKF
tara:strand:- start:2050 stop:2961 length:912 start_codon:yes stop_codon:yes gene_type:complete